MIRRWRESTDGMVEDNATGEYVLYEEYVKFEALARASSRLLACSEEDEADAIEDVDIAFREIAELAVKTLVSMNDKDLFAMLALVPK